MPEEENEEFSEEEATGDESTPSEEEVEGDTGESEPELPPASDSAKRVDLGKLKGLAGWKWAAFRKTFSALFFRPDEVLADRGKETYLNPYEFFGAMSVLFLVLTNLVPWQSISAVFFANTHRQWLKFKTYWWEFREVPAEQVDYLQQTQSAAFQSEWTPFFTIFTEYFFRGGLWLMMGLSVPIIAFFAFRMGKKAIPFQDHLAAFTYYTALKLTLLLIYSPLLVVGFGFAFVSGFLMQLLFNVPMKLFFTDFDTNIAVHYRELISWYFRIMLLLIVVAGYWVKMKAF